MDLGSSQGTGKRLRILFKIYAAFQTKFDYISCSKEIDLEDISETDKVTKKLQLLESLNEKISPVKPFKVDGNLTGMLSSTEAYYVGDYPVLHSGTIDEIKNLQEKVVFPDGFENISLHFDVLRVGAWIFPYGCCVLEITLSASLPSDEMNSLCQVVRVMFFESEDTFKISFGKKSENVGIGGIIEKYRDLVLSRLSGSAQVYTHIAVFVRAERALVQDQVDDLAFAVSNVDLDLGAKKPFYLSGKPDTVVVISGIGSLVVTPSFDIFYKYRQLALVSLEEFATIFQLEIELRKEISEISRSLKEIESGVMRLNEREVDRVMKTRQRIEKLIQIRQDLEKFQMKIFDRIARYHNTEALLSHYFPKAYNVFLTEFHIAKKRKTIASKLNFLTTSMSRQIEILIEKMRWELDNEIQQIEQNIQQRILSLQKIFSVGVAATLISAFLVLSQHTSLFHPLNITTKPMCALFYFFLVIVITAILYGLASHGITEE